MAATQLSNRQLSNTPSVVNVMQLISLTAAYTLTSQTGLQKIFNASTTGALTIAAGTYFFKCAYDLSAMSATSGNFGFGFLGTAVITSVKYTSIAKKAALATAATGQIVTASVATATGLVTASTVTTGSAYIKGIIRITTAGTLIPSTSLGVAAAAIIGVNSFFVISPVSTNNTTTFIGAWS